MDCQLIYQGLVEQRRRFREDFPWQRLRPQFQLQAYDSLPSTNAQLWQLVSEGRARAGTVVLAATQSAGRGQRGRQWQSPPGGLYLSLLLEPSWAADQAAQLTFCGVWGVAIALKRLGIPIQIKWPNDLVVWGRKLGGLLTETKIEQGLIKQAVLGIGINWQNLTPETGITLREVLGYSPVATLTRLEDLAAVTLLGLWQGLCYRQQVGSKAFMKAYEKELTHLNRAVTWKGNLGRIVGVDETGYLQLQLQSSEVSPALIEQRVSIPPSEIALGYNGSEN